MTGYSKDRMDPEPTPHREAAPQECGEVYQQTGQRCQEPAGHVRPDGYMIHHASNVTWVTEAATIKTQWEHPKDCPCAKCDADSVLRRMHEAEADRDALRSQVAELQAGIDRGEEVVTLTAHEQEIERRLAAESQLEGLRAQVDGLAYYLQIFVHAHASGNSVPPHMEQAARAALSAYRAPASDRGAETPRKRQTHRWNPDTAQRQMMCSKCGMTRGWGVFPKPMPPCPGEPPTPSGGAEPESKEAKP